MEELPFKNHLRGDDDPLKNIEYLPKDPFKDIQISDEEVFRTAIVGSLISGGTFIGSLVLRSVNEIEFSKGLATVALTFAILSIPALGLSDYIERKKLDHLKK